MQPYVWCVGQSLHHKYIKHFSKIIFTLSHVIDVTGQMNNEQKLLHNQLRLKPSLNSVNEYKHFESTDLHTLCVYFTNKI